MKNYFIKELLNKTDGKVTLIIDSEKKTYDDGLSALNDLKDEYVVISVCGKSEGICIEMQKYTQNSLDDSWAKEYKSQTGKEVSFF